MQIDYTAEISKARSMQRLASEMETQQKAIFGLMDELPDHWSGEAAEAYYIQCLLLRQKLKSASEEITKTAQTIGIAADKIKNAD